MDNSIRLNSGKPQIESCEETYQRLKREAKIIVPTPQQLDVIRKLLNDVCSIYSFDRNANNNKGNEIERFFEENVFFDLTIRENGKVGLYSISGDILVPIEYEDIDFTYDSPMPYSNLFVVKKNGKWGVIDNKSNIIIPFEYDQIFRTPYHIGDYVVKQNGKYGYITTIPFPSNQDKINIPCIMDNIYFIPGYSLIAFSKDGKWGWNWWKYCDDLYYNYGEPKYDELIFKPEDEIYNADDDEDLFFYARKGDDIKGILCWTPEEPLPTIIKP